MLLKKQPGRSAKAVFQSLFNSKETRKRLERNELPTD